MSKSKLVEGSRDYELIKKIKNCKEGSVEQINYRNQLFGLYAALVTKMRNNLICRANKTRLPLDFEVEEYHYFAFEKFIQAVNSTDMSKITDPTKFLLYIQYFNYLRSLNRDLIAHRIKICNNESQLISIANTRESSNLNDQFSKHNILESQEAGRTESAEDESLKNMKSDIVNRAIDYCLEKKFNDIQKKIFVMKSDEKTLKSIISELEISGSEYYKEIKNIRSILKNTLQKISSEEKIDLELSYINS